MNEMIGKIVDGLRELFPDAGDMAISADTELGEIPDWDSMAAVNLQSFLEEAFRISVPHDMLSEESTVGDVMAYMTRPTAAAAAR